MTSIPFSFYLDWIICAQFAGLCWAKAAGLYDAQGLDVTLIPWQEDGRGSVEKVLAGGLCAGCTEDNLVVSAIAQGHGVKIIGAMLQKTPLVLMSRPDRQIRRIQDLRGKRIGMHNDGNRALQMVLALEGIGLDELEIVEVPFGLEHLSENRCDALQGYVMTEPIELEARGVAVDVLPVSHERLQPYAQAYFASDTVIAGHGAMLKTFLAVSHAGWRAVLADPDQAARIVADMMGDPTQAAQQRKMLDRLLPLVAGDLPASQIGALLPTQWQRNLETYHAHGLIDRPLALPDVLDTTLLDSGAVP